MCCYLDLLGLEVLWDWAGRGLTPLACLPMKLGLQSTVTWAVGSSLGVVFGVLPGPPMYPKGAYILWFKIKAVILGTLEVR